MKKVFVLIEVLILSVGIIVSFVFLSRGLMISNQITKGYTVSATPTVKKTPIPTPTPEDTCNNLLVLVNKHYSLPSTYTPPDLVYLTLYGIPVSSNTNQGRLEMVVQLSKMYKDAKADGISLIVLSSYRSYATQKSLFTSYESADGYEAANQYSALPGQSQHQLGTAIDFSSDEISNQLDQAFGNTKAAAWLAQNAYKYGFVIAYPQGEESVTGYEYEPWHYRYIGVNNALKMKQSGLILEVYLEKYGLLPSNC